MAMEKDLICAVNSCSCGHGLSRALHGSQTQGARRGICGLTVRSFDLRGCGDVVSASRTILLSRFIHTTMNTSARFKRWCEGIGSSERFIVPYEITASLLLRVGGPP